MEDIRKKKNLDATSPIEASGTFFVFKKIRFGEQALLCSIPEQTWNTVS